MSADLGPIPRIVVATVALGRTRLTESAANIVADAVVAANFIFVRSVTVNRDAQFIKLLVSNVSNDNQADAIILIGGTGFGPRDFTCEALDEFVERRIEGFGEAYRSLLRNELGMGASALLARASAGVYNKCVVFALPRMPAELAHAMRALVIPILREAVQHASGRRLTIEPPPSGTSPVTP
jgi:molybdenum cofactor biosynthesis protein B